MCSSAYSAVQRISPDQPFDGVRTGRIQAAHSAARGLNKPVADFAAVGDIRSYVRFSFCEKQGRAPFSCKARLVYIRPRVVCRCAAISVGETLRQQV